MGPGDHHCDPGQAVIATEKPRDKHDNIIVQAKLDGSNVGVVCLGGYVLAINRAGYDCSSSPHKQHRLFADWVQRNKSRFSAILADGERICGEWLIQAHGTRYDLPHEPFVVFDIMRESTRLPFNEFKRRVNGLFQIPKTLSDGQPISIETAMRILGNGFHGELEPPEGVVYRVERNELIDTRKSSDRHVKVDFVVKYVRPDKVDGKYLEAHGFPFPIWNTYPGENHGNER